MFNGAISIHFEFSTYKALPQRTKDNLHLFSLFVLIRHGAEGGSDRFYA
ncbi:hypothetical protein [Bacillus arachidis]|nr:hypothetical protein [Bacillus arachidis]WIY61500.1 hypothetical protein QRY57_02500 [Bacillus arachidis]